MTELPILTWFPKRLSAGDTLGEGQKKILGRPDIDVMELLIRESAQNSWDARLPGRIPVYQLRLRKLDGEALAILRERVFVESAPDLDLAQVLDQPELTVMEVVDRNTKGLGGPTRNDMPLEPDKPRDYVDFVLNIGAPPDNVNGAGTYGFGKTASYLASACSTIIIWTRTRDHQDQMVDRFIASAMGSSFTGGEGNHERFTGRQWWGLPTPGLQSGQFQFNPVEGHDAAALGQQLFERGFEPDETGTSLMILQPKGHENPTELIERWSSAVHANLWPKLTDDQPAERRMRISIHHAGRQLPLVKAADSPILGGQEACLRAIRTIQSDGKDEPDPLVTIEKVESLRPKMLLGHVAMARAFAQDDDPHSDAAGTLTYMRGSAELVVRADRIPTALEGPLSWVAVFKPLPCHEEMFAQSEPPAHDSWSPDGLEDRQWRTHIRNALKRSKEKVMEFLQPRPVATPGGEATSTGALSASLAGLAGSATGSLAMAGSRAPSNRGGQQAGPRNSRPKVNSAAPLPISAAQLLDRRQSSRFEVEVDGLPGAGLRVVHAAELGLAVDGGAMSSPDLVMIEGWWDVEGVYRAGSEIVAAPLDLIHVEVSYPLGLAAYASFSSGDAS